MFTNYIVPMSHGYNVKKDIVAMTHGYIVLKLHCCYESWIWYLKRKTNIVAMTHGYNV